jgi:hypothetical protein
MWLGQKHNFNKINEMPEIRDSCFFVGVYNDFLQKLKSTTDNETLIRLQGGVIITDLPEYAIIAEIHKEITLADTRINLKTLNVTTKRAMNLTSVWEEIPFKDYSIKLNIDIKNYYQNVLHSYNKVSFFEHFNTFKYSAPKNVRSHLEEVLYLYFSKTISARDCREKFQHLEKELHKNHSDRFKPIKTFINSTNLEVLRELVEEQNPVEVTKRLNESNLDYFDVNYLKAYLRDYQKKKKPLEETSEQTIVNF